MPVGDPKTCQLHSPDDAEHGLLEIEPQQDLFGIAVGSADWWHGIIRADRLVRTSGWRDGTPARPSLRGKKAGVVGLGRNGTAIANPLVAHEIEAAFWGQRDKPGVPYVGADSLIELATRSDILIVTSRAAPENAWQIDADVLRVLGPTGMLINVARGFLIDEPASLRSCATARSPAQRSMFSTRSRRIRADGRRWRTWC